MGTLYLVATPIGNFEDMSPRGVRTLGEVRLIAAEDTRVTRKLLSHFDLHTLMTSYFEHNKMKKLDSIIEALGQGDVALVSDAGTPAINDPGYELVVAALRAGHNVCPVPGPSAPMAALAASGLPTDQFLYLGYLPRRSSDRYSFLRTVASLSYTLIFLETPRRLLESLADLETSLGNRKIAVARELTKFHEEIWRGTISEARSNFQQNQPRGEFTLVIGGKNQSQKKKWEMTEVKNAVESGLTSHETPSIIAKRVAEESGWDRREVYKMTTNNKKGDRNNGS